MSNESYIYFLHLWKALPMFIFGLLCYSLKVQSVNLEEDPDMMIFKHDCITDERNDSVLPSKLRPQILPWK